MQKTSPEDVLREKGMLVHFTVGDSMWPMLHNRSDHVLVVPANGRLKKYDLPLYKRPNGQYVMHRILKVRDADYITCGDNRRYKEKGITDDMIIGVAKGYWRNEKYIDCRNKWYRLYVHLWCDFFMIRSGILFIRDLPRRIRKKIRKEAS